MSSVLRPLGVARVGPLRKTAGPGANILLQLSVVVLTICAVAYVGSDATLSADEKMQQLAMYVVLQLVLQMWIMIRTFRSFLNPPVVFALLLSIFSSGWLILRAFNAQEAPNDVLSRLPTDSLNNAAMFYLVAYAFFGLGMIVVGPKGREVEERTDDHERELREDARRKALVRVGSVCAWIGVIPFAVINFNNFSVLIDGGYSAYYAPDARISNPILALGHYLIVGLVFLGVAADGRRARGALWGLLAIAVLRLLAGDRGEGFIYLLTVAMIWRTQTAAAPVRRLSKLRSGLYLVCGVLLIPAIGSFRQFYGGGTWNLRAVLIEQNPVVETLRTLGTTLYPLVRVVELVPRSNDYLLGGSYLSGPLRLLPSGLRPDWATEPLYSSPANWLRERMDLSYGPGFTPFAEAYLNFGFVVGCFVLFVVGMGSALLLRVSPSASTTRLAIVFTTFALAGFAVRGSSNFVAPYLVRFVVIPVAVASTIAASNLRARRETPA